MECTKRCPLKSNGQGKCTKEKCEFWVTEVIEARPEQCVKTLYAGDFMSQTDYTDLVRLSVMSEKVQHALEDATLALGNLGKPSIFHPTVSKRITEKQQEIIRLEKRLQEIQVIRESLFKRYEKVKINLMNGILRKGAYSLNYTTYNARTLSWEIGGVRLGEEQTVSRCELPYSLCMDKAV